MARPSRWPRVAPLAAGCGYVRLLRASVLEQLNPRVVRLVDELPATDDGVVFSGEPSGMFDAFDAFTGALLWQFQTGSGIHSNPITYAAAGKQYVAVPAGWGG